jgi:CRP-like cAMP-binding protein
MEDPVIQFIESYVKLAPEEVDIILEQNLIKSYRKDAILLAEGEQARECFFILSGCVRRYYLIDGEERSTEFYTELQPINPVSYVTKQPSDYFLSCLEESIISVSTPERGQKLLERVPKLYTLVQQLQSELLVKNELSLDSFKNLSPEARYLKFMEARPDLMNRIPLAHLATYLGITPVSLSRIRKRTSLSKAK